MEITNPLDMFKAMRDKDPEGRELWQFVTDEQKELYFFIFNRYFSKKFPEKSQLLNDKSINKVASMELIRQYLIVNPYPSWFWSKSKKTEKIKGYSDKEINLLMSKFDIKFEELEFLIYYYPDEVKEELKYLSNFI